MVRAIRFLFVSLLSAALPATANVSAQAGPPPPEAEFIAESVAVHLDSPWAAAFPSADTALVTLKGGTVLAVDLATGTRTTVSGVPRIRSYGQGGLLDIVLAPDFPVSGEVYLSFAEERSGSFGTSIARARYRADPPRLEGWKVVFAANNRSSSPRHFGSRIAFDRDGRLVATVGERDERRRARNLRDHGGKTVRLDREGRALPDNPLIGKDAAPEIFTYGHRNAQGLALNPATGALWLHEHGPRGGDEVNILIGGGDYGWPVATYGREYSGGAVGTGATDAPGTVQPLLHWTPSIAPSGMAFYAGSAFPGWKGDLLVGALAGKELRRVELDGDRVIGQTSYLRGWARIRDVRVGPGGLVYILSDGADAGLWRLSPR